MCVSYFVYSELIFIFKVTIWENTYYVIYKEWVWEGLGWIQSSGLTLGSLLFTAVFFTEIKWK